MNRDLKQPGLFNFVLELIIYFIHVVVKGGKRNNRFTQGGKRNGNSFRTEVATCVMPKSKILVR